MNDLKKHLTAKVELLKKGKPLIYQHTDGSETREYLLMSAEKVNDDTLESIIKNCVNLSILASDDFLRRSGCKVFSAEATLKCNFSISGIKHLISQLEQGQEGSGPDRIIMRIVSSDKVLSDNSAESRLLELMSNVDNADGFLLYGLLLSKEEKFKAESITTEEVQISRFFNPNLLEFTGVLPVELQQGTFKLHSYYSEIDRRYHWAFVIDGQKELVPLVRIESECLTGHVFGSLLCDCGDQLSRGLAQVAAYGRGALVYLRQEGRGIGLEAKLEAYYLQQVHGMDTVDANLAVGMPEDARDYVIGAQILNHLGFDRIKLMTNNPAKLVGLSRYGIQLDEQVSHIIPPSDHNRRYLETKKTRMGHRI
jgi:GTP cyclohydrolase II